MKLQTQFTVPKKELKSAQHKVRKMIKNRTIKKYMKKSEKDRKKYGQSTTIIATK